MTAPFVTLLWGSNKNPALSTKDTGRETLEGKLRWDLDSKEAALGILCAGRWTSEQALASFFLAKRAANTDDWRFARVEANRVAKFIDSPEAPAPRECLITS